MADSVETSNLDNQQFRLNKTNDINDYFTPEIKVRLSPSPKNYLLH